MSWSDILTLAIVLSVATFFVWRSSESKNHKHGCGCGCAGDESASKKETTAP